MIEEMNDKKADIESTAERAIKDKYLLAELVGGLKEKNETYRYNCYKVIYLLSQTHGDIIYPYWDAFAKSLRSENSYHKMAAIHLIANLVPEDKNNKFDEIFDTYYGLLDDKSMIVAYYIAEASGKVVNARPDLDVKITDRLLDINKTRHPAGRKELVKAGIIMAFDTYFENYAGKTAVLDFVRAQINSESNKTKKAAKAFLKKWDN